MRFFTLAFAFVFALGLTACQQEAPPPPAEPLPEETMDAEMPAPVGEPTVAETNAALEQGVGAIPAQDALNNIDGWIARLEGAEFAQRDDIVQGLRDLRAALQESPIDGGRVADLLEDLGSWTSQAGTDAGNADVQRLGQLLTENAQRLRGN